MKRFSFLNVILGLFLCFISAKSFANVNDPPEQAKDTNFEQAFPIRFAAPVSPIEITVSQVASQDEPSSPISITYLNQVASGGMDFPKENVISFVSSTFILTRNDAVSPCIGINRSDQRYFNAFYNTLTTPFLASRIWTPGFDPNKRC